MYDSTAKSLRTAAKIWLVITEIMLIIAAIILLRENSILYAILTFLLGTLSAGTSYLLMMCVSDCSAYSSRAAAHLDRVIKHIPYIPNGEEEEKTDSTKKELKESDPCRVCVVCGKVSPASEFICPVCGMGLPVITVPYTPELPEKTERKAPSQIISSLKICGKCGTENSSKMIYCEKCGNKL